MTTQKPKPAAELPMLGLIHMEAGTMAQQANDGYAQTTIVAICMASSKVLIDRRKGNTAEFDKLFEIAASMDPEEAEKILAGFTESSKRFETNTLKRAGVPDEMIAQMHEVQTTAMRAQMTKLIAIGSEGSLPSPEARTTRLVTPSA